MAGTKTLASLDTYSMKYFICRPLKRFMSERLCHKAPGRSPEDLPEQCKDCNPEEAQKEWRQYDAKEVFGDELYQEFKAVWQDREKK